MPPKKKKQPHNAFYFFMLDWKATQERAGQRFVDLKEVSEMCSDDWKVIPPSLLKKYKLMEAEAKKKGKDDLCSKYNSLGVPLDVVKGQQQEQESSVHRMHRDIDDLLNLVSSSRDDLMNQYFYLVHTNVYCYWGLKQVYIPCEVAISKFTLKNGVVDTYHVFPAPYTEECDIPMGYKYQVRTNSEQVHAIPEPSEFDKLEYDWKKIRSDINSFLRPFGGNVPPLFTVDLDDSNTNCHITAVKNFFDLVTDDSTDVFQVYSLALLFFKLYEVCRQVAVREFQDQERAFPVEAIAHQQLLKDIYNFSEGIACKFHETTNHYHNCSLSFVKRWVFLICEFCCRALRIELIPGRHCIATANISASWKPQPKLQTNTSTTPAIRKASDARDDSGEDSDDDDDDDDNGEWCTVSHQMRNLKLDKKKDDSGVGAWSTVSRGQFKVKDKKAAVDDEEVLFIDSSKMPDPKQTRIFRTGQSPNVVSEVMPDSAPPSVRLPTSRGRGETMARALGFRQSEVASFSSEDFPAIGASKPGRLAKPLASGWGRGFMKQ